MLETGLREAVSGLTARLCRQYLPASVCNGDSTWLEGWLETICKCWCISSVVFDYLKLLMKIRKPNSLDDICGKESWEKFATNSEHLDLNRPVSDELVIQSHTSSVLARRIFIGVLAASGVIFDKVDASPTSDSTLLSPPSSPKLLATISVEGIDIMPSVVSADVTLCSWRDLSSKEPRPSDSEVLGSSSGEASRSRLEFDLL
jgi:hypothetical protein